MANLLETAISLQPLVRAHADASEAQRHLSREVAQAFAEAGLYRIAGPRDSLGSEQTPATQVEVIEAIAYADGHLYFRYQDGVVALIEATPKGYKLKSKFRESRTKAQTWPQPVIAQKRLYLRDQEILRCYNIASP